MEARMKNPAELVPDALKANCAMSIATFVPQHAAIRALARVSSDAVPFASAS